MHSYPGTRVYLGTGAVRLVVCIPGYPGSTRLPVHGYGHYRTSYPLSCTVGAIGEASVLFLPPVFLACFCFRRQCQNVCASMVHHLGGVLGCGIAQRAARLQKAKRCAISFSDVSVQNYFSMAKFGRTPSAVVRPLEERDADPRALSVRLVRARKHVAQEFLRRGERRRRFAKRTGRL